MLGQSLRVQLKFDCAPLHDGSTKNTPKFIGSFRLGNYVSGKGEGSSKRTAKLNAAIDTVINLRKSAADIIENFLSDQKIDRDAFEKSLSQGKEDENCVANATSTNEINDYISKLQQLAVNRRWIMPRYEDFAKGEDQHQPEFVVKASIVIGARTYNEYGRSSSKKEAKKEAAKKLYCTLESDPKIARGAGHENSLDTKTIKKTVSYS